MSGPYDDILHLPHHVSHRYPRMPMIDRAAQFSPFAALTGYDAAVKETARLTDMQIELDESQKGMLDRKLREAAETHMSVKITYFVPDDKKSGGAYVNAVGKVKRIDTLNMQILLDDGTEIPIQTVLEING